MAALQGPSSPVACGCQPDELSRLSESVISSSQEDRLYLQWGGAAACPSGDAAACGLLAAHGCSSWYEGVTSLTGAAEQS